MIKKMLHILTLAAVLLTVFPLDSFSQSTPTSTTLSAAMDDRATRFIVASATGFVASTGTLDYGVFVDREFMRITAVSSTTITVQRGQANTNQTSHRSGARVWVGRYSNSVIPGSAGGPFVQSALRGSCTASGYSFLPVIQVNANATDGQAMYNCNNGQWLKQTLLDDIAPTLTRYCMPPGLQALALLTTNGDANAPFVVGNNQTPVAGTVYYGTIEIPRTMLVTGLSILNGTVAGTDDLYMGLFRADGVLLANTLLTGTAASGIGRFQDIALTATFLATGPARYWISVTSEGTTTRFRNVNLTPGASTAGLGAFIGMLGSSFVNTAPALPNLTASVAAANPTTGSLPTTLIANTAPIACVY